jgi:hypothetical protein
MIVGALLRAAEKCAHKCCTDFAERRFRRRQEAEDAVAEEGGQASRQAVWVLSGLRLIEHDFRLQR